jgi:hypothetical protein
VIDNYDKKNSLDSPVKTKENGKFKSSSNSKTNPLKANSGKKKVVNPTGGMTSYN